MNPCNYSKQSAKKSKNHNDLESIKIDNFLNLQEKIDIVDINQIDVANKRFEIKCKVFDSSSLTESIGQIGLINMPVVWMDPDSVQDSFIIVAGFRRISAAYYNLGETRIKCRILPKNCHAGQCALLAIADNATQQPLLAGELIRALCLLKNFYNNKQIAEISKPLLGQELSCERIKILLSISEMKDSWLELLDAGQITIKSALKISSWNELTQRDWHDVFSSIKVSSSKQAQMLEAFSEIMARDKINSQDIFSSSEVRQIMDIDQQNPGIKGEMLRKYLITKRFPYLEYEKARIKAHTMRLALPKGIKLKIPENFESQEYGISLKFTNHKQLTQKIEQLNNTLSHPSWEKILSRQG